MNTVISKAVQQVLQKFFINVDANVSLGVFSSNDIHLNDLVLKPSVLNELNLPVQITYGRLEKLHLKIPWKSLYSGEIAVVVEGLYLLATPNSSVKYDPEKEEIKLQQAKQAELKKIEDAKKKENEPPNTENPGLVQMFIMQIINNFQLSIKNVHIRYEEPNPTEGGKPYALGISLSNLFIQTTNENWVPAVLERGCQIGFKLVNLEGLAAYWNCNTTLFGNVPAEGNPSHMFLKDIATKDTIPQHYSYILGPINSSARVILNMHPENNSPAYSRPKVHAELVMHKLSIGLTKDQYKDVLNFADTMSYESRGLPFRKYRPDLQVYKGHYKKWWQFAYTCILETQVRRQKQNWNWVHMLEHRNLCKKYGETYKNKLCNKLPKNELVELNNMECTLDIFNLVLIRQQIEMEVEKMDKMRENLRQNTGWFGGWWSKSRTDVDSELEESTNMLSKFQQAMTPEEREKLFKAIDYTDNIPLDYPVSFVENILKFHLENFEINIQHDHNESVILSKLQDVKCSIEQRQKGMKVAVIVSDFSVLGMARNDILPELITSQIDESGPLLEVLFELNPLDGNYGQRLHLSARPIKMICDTTTVLKAIDIFKTPPSTTLDQLSQLTAAKMNQIKQMSATGMQHIIEQHTFMDLKVNFAAPYIIVPYGGTFTGAENLLVVNLGKLCIKSIDGEVGSSSVHTMHKAGVEKNEMMETMISQCYDNFEIELSNIQAMVAQSDEEWFKYIEGSSMESGPVHILHPLTLNLHLQTCMIPDDPKLPLTKVKGEMPNIDLQVTDARLLLLMDLLDSIANEFTPDTSKMVVKSYSSQSLYKEFDIPDGKIVQIAEKKSSVENLVQLTQLKLEFELKELSVKLSHQEMLSSPITEIVNFKMNSMKLKMIKQTFNMDVDVSLSSMSMGQDRLTNSVEIIQTHGDPTTKQCLFNVSIVQVDKKSPEFYTKYGGSECTILFNFGSLTVTLNQEALLDLMKFGSDIQMQFEERQKAQARPKWSSTDSPMRRTTSSSFSAKLSIPMEPKRALKLKNNIIFKMVARVQALSVYLESDQGRISYLAIKGIAGDVVVRPSHTEVEMKLTDLLIQDLNEKNLHTNILSVQPNQQAVQVLLIINNSEEEKEKFGMSVKVRLGQLRLCFINWYIKNVLDFLNKFQTAQQALADASNKAANAAKENMANIYENATKIALDIEIRAPEIIVPECSSSRSGLLIDLGFITIKNQFNTLQIKSENGSMPVIDELLLKLENLKIERVVLTEGLEVESRCVMLEPLSFVLEVHRNLSAWYRGVPSIDLIGNIENIQVVVGQKDYESLMNILSKNLSEGTAAIVPEITTSETGTTVVEYNAKAPQKSDITEPDHVHILVRWSFNMSCFKIDLMTERGRGAAIDGEQKRNGLANFALEGLAVRGRMLSNNTISNVLLLNNCLLFDMRPGHSEINCLLSRAVEEPEGADSGTVRNMIDVTFQQKHADIFVDVRIYSFTFIISVDLLMELSQFFASTQPEKTEPVAVAHVDSKKALQAKESKAISETMLTLTLKLEKPHIILVENMESVQTKALILNSEILLKVRLMGARQTINGSISDLQLYTCVFDPEVREKTKNQVLQPVTISIAGSTPDEKGLHIEIFVTDLIISVSLYSIELLMKILNTVSAGGAARREIDAVEDDHSNLWEIKQSKENQFWFLKSEEAEDALSFNYTDAVKKKGPALNELCILNLPVVLVTLEAGVGNKTFPMLLFEAHFQGKVNDWSTQLVVESTLSIQMGYYNSLLALWEPLIEPVSVQKGNECVLEPWEIRMEVSMNNDNMDESQQSPSTTVADVGDIPSLQPSMSIDISSNKNLELTVTKTALDVLTTIGKMFAAAIESPQDVIKSEDDAPYLVINTTGLEITLLLDDSVFKLCNNEEASVLTLETGAEVYLNLETSATKKLVNTLRGKSSVAERYLNVKVPEMDAGLRLPVIKADTRYFMLRDKPGWGLVSSVKVDNGVTIITLSSILQVHNNFNVAIDLYYMRNSGNELEYIATIKPDSSYHVPMNAVYSQTSELFFSVADYSVTTKPFVWKDLQLNVVVNKNLTCCSKSNGDDVFIIRAVGELSQVYFETTNKHTMASTIYDIYLRPAVILKNCLPLDITMCIRDAVNKTVIKTGDKLEIPHVEPGKSYVILRIHDYLEKEWSCRRDVSHNPAPFTVWTFDSYDGVTKMTLDLGMHTLEDNGTLTMTLYCPFWMINKTGLFLSYRSTDENLNILNHPPNFKGPILFSFNAKNFFGKKKACVRIDQSEWSDKFSIDVAGSSGVVVCKHQGMVYQICVSNRLTNNGLTKQITFTPHYVIINHTALTMECQEMDRPADAWVSVEPKSCSAFWPSSEADDKLIKVRIAGMQDITAPFLFTESHTTLLKLKNKYGGINVDIQLTEGATYINLALYDQGMAPALVINNTKHTMNFWEKESVQIRKLPPNNYMLYTWDNPSSQRILVWEGGQRKEIENTLRMDGVGDYSISESHSVYWTSFLDGMQRVLLFTSEQSVLQNAQASSQFEKIDKEITVSIYGIGLSIVNNLKRQEVMYIGIASTGIIWETCKFNAKRFKQVSTKDNANMERCYQQYLALEQNPTMHAEPLMMVDDITEVDFEMLVMSKPHKRKVRRRFQTGLWFQMKTSPHQMQIHAKINRLQIDNQLYDCTFPVALAPVPPPKSIALNAHKPFAELSIVQLLMKNSQIQQYKYFKVLIQEFHVKIDLGFVNALMEVFASSAMSDADEKANFMYDLQQVDEVLYALVSTQSLQEQKSFYDMLHFSPLKIHVSFSMAAGGSNQGISNMPVFLSVLLQGIGVTLTDLQDVVFKLAYFQREYQFLNKRQLASEATAHYVGQTVKQLYVLVLGLDVIGNPYGLVLGITKGVEDLFYEPFQGAIQGPGEFAEGLMLGVASLFGHTIGGAAGAVSKITGAMGKGIAALTFDKEYQRKRRDQMNKKPDTVHGGLARGGKGLVMGVVDGVTGVFTKPISGAKEQGVGGFFKGLGKGAVGLVTRPTAGVMDFASSSFDTVKRVADFGHEEVQRLRLPRFVEEDTYVKAYNTELAYGNRLLCELEKGKYSTTDIYLSHFVVIPKKEILLLSNKRLAYITHNDLFGGWQVAWAHTWQELDKPPTISRKGVQISVMSKRKGLLQSSDHGKLILITDDAVQETIISHITHQMNIQRSTSHNVSHA